MKVFDLIILVISIEGNQCSSVVSLDLLGWLSTLNSLTLFLELRHVFYVVHIASILEMLADPHALAISLDDL